MSEFGTPLYLFDEVSLRRKCAEFKNEFQTRYPDTSVIYACKAFINKALAVIFREEGLGLDVVSGGELGIARSVSFPMDRVYFHGNNKSAEEIAMALSGRIGCIVVDNFYELDMLDGMAKERGHRQDIMLRLTPGIDPHTHRYIATGVIDSKFGFPMARGDAAVSRALASTGVRLLGLHFHAGSLIHEIETYQRSIDVVLDFAAEMKGKYDFQLKELGVGGGYAIRYTQDDEAPPVATYATAITARVAVKCREKGLEQPRIVIEPGRAIVGQAGVALYRAGAIKDITGVRCYVSVDGGMADNIRPALYGSKYEAALANRMLERVDRKVTIAGKFCESGDILIKDASLPEVVTGDIIAVPSSGAYSLPMASNYNSSLKPPVILVRDGKARLIRRRETINDLTMCDLV